jgi:hypothetical protein
LDYLAAVVGWLGTWKWILRLHHGKVLEQLGYYLFKEPYFQTSWSILNYYYFSGFPTWMETAWNVPTFHKASASFRVKVLVYPQKFQKSLWHGTTFHRFHNECVFFILNSKITFLSPWRNWQYFKCSSDQWIFNIKK